MRKSRGNNGYIGNKSALTNSLAGVMSGNKIIQLSNDAHSQEPPRTEYERPDWEEIPEVNPGDDIFYGVYAVYNNDSNFVAMRFYTNTGLYEVDWGDGTVTQHSSNTVAEHQYDTSTYASLSSSVVRGYKTILITVTPVTAGAHLTRLFLYEKHSSLSSIPHTTNQWLDIRMAGEEFVQVQYSTTQETAHTFSGMLERIDFIGTAKLGASGIFFGNCLNLQEIVAFPSCQNVTTYGSCFYRCYKLRRIPDSIWGENTRSSTYFGYCFVDCVSLEEVKSFNTSGVTNASGFISMFSGCRSLRKVGYFDTRNYRVTGLFTNCYSLEHIQESFNTTGQTDFGSMFSGCASLKRAPRLDTSSATLMSSMFFSCQDLIEVPDMDTSNVTSFSQMFYQCYSLKRTPTLDCSSGTTCYRMFRDCYSLEEVNITDVSSATDVTEMFYWCRSLKQIPTMTMKPTNTVTFTSMFQECEHLVEIPALNFAGANATLTNTFADCKSLSRCQITGLDQTVSFANCRLGATALNEIYTNLASVTAKTITVTNNWGTSSDNPSIATSKGWTVTG